MNCDCEKTRLPGLTYICPDHHLWKRKDKCVLPLNVNAQDATVPLCENGTTKSTATITVEVKLNGLERKINV